jgi:hypothetical protein
VRVHPRDQPSRGSKPEAGLLSMGALSPNPSVVDCVIEGLANGLLWTLDGGPIWMGYGTYKHCVVCHRQIGLKEIRYDVPGPRGAAPAHGACYRVWREQSDRRQRHSLAPSARRPACPGQ